MLCLLADEAYFAVHNVAELQLYEIGYVDAVS